MSLRGCTSAGGYWLPLLEKRGSLAFPSSLKVPLPCYGLEWGCMYLGVKASIRLGAGAAFNLIG